MINDSIWLGDCGRTDANLVADGWVVRSDRQTGSHCPRFDLGTAATALLVQLPSWTSLVIARFMLGVGTGLATTAGTAYVTEILSADRAKTAALAVTSATSLGFGGGALATGISLGFQGPTLLPVSYIVLFVIAPALAMVALALPRHLSL